MVGSSNNPNECGSNSSNSKEKLSDTESSSSSSSDLVKQTRSKEVDQKSTDESSCDESEKDIIEPDAKLNEEPTAPESEMKIPRRISRAEKRVSLENQRAMFTRDPSKYNIMLHESSFTGTQPGESVEDPANNPYPEITYLDRIHDESSESSDSSSDKDISQSNDPHLGPPTRKYAEAGIASAASPEQSDMDSDEIMKTPEEKVKNPKTNVKRRISHAFKYIIPQIRPERTSHTTDKPDILPVITDQRSQSDISGISHDPGKQVPETDRSSNSSHDSDKSGRKLSNLKKQFSNAESVFLSSESSLDGSVEDKAYFLDNNSDANITGHSEINAELANSLQLQHDSKKVSSIGGSVTPSTQGEINEPESGTAEEPDPPESQRRISRRISRAQKQTSIDSKRAMFTRGPSKYHIMLHESSFVGGTSVEELGNKADPEVSPTDTGHSQPDDPSIKPITTTNVIASSGESDTDEGAKQPIEELKHPRKSVTRKLSNAFRAVVIPKLRPGSSTDSLPKAFEPESALSEEESSISLGTVEEIGENSVSDESNSGRTTSNLKEIGKATEKSLSDQIDNNLLTQAVPVVNRLTRGDESKSMKEDKLTSPTSQQNLDLQDVKNKRSDTPRRLEQVPPSHKHSGYGEQPGNLDSSRMAAGTEKLYDPGFVPPVRRRNDPIPNNSPGALGPPTRNHAKGIPSLPSRVGSIDPPAESTTDPVAASPPQNLSLPDQNNSASASEPDRTKSDYKTPTRAFSPPARHHAPSTPSTSSKVRPIYPPIRRHSSKFDGLNNAPTQQLGPPSRNHAMSTPEPETTKPSSKTKKGKKMSLRGRLSSIVKVAGRRNSTVLITKLPQINTPTDYVSSDKDEDVGDITHTNKPIVNPDPSDASPPMTKNALQDYTKAIDADGVNLLDKQKNLSHRISKLSPKQPEEFQSQGGKSSSSSSSEVTSEGYSKEKLLKQAPTHIGNFEKTQVKAQSSKSPPKRRSAVVTQTTGDLPINLNELLKPLQKIVRPASSEESISLDDSIGPLIPIDFELEERLRRFKSPPVSRVPALTPIQDTPETIIESYFSTEPLVPLPRTSRLPVEQVPNPPATPLRKRRSSKKSAEDLPIDIRRTSSTDVPKRRKSIFAKAVSNVKKTVAKKDSSKVERERKSSAASSLANIDHNTTLGLDKSDDEISRILDPYFIIQHETTIDGPTKPKTLSDDLMIDEVLLGIYSPDQQRKNFRRESFGSKDTLNYAPSLTSLYEADISQDHPTRRKRSSTRKLSHPEASLSPELRRDAFSPPSTRSLSSGTHPRIRPVSTVPADYISSSRPVSDSFYDVRQECPTFMRSLGSPNDSERSRPRPQNINYLERETSLGASRPNDLNITETSLPNIYGYLPSRGYEDTTSNSISSDAFSLPKTAPIFAGLSNPDYGFMRNIGQRRQSDSMVSYASVQLDQHPWQRQDSMQYETSLGRSNSGFVETHPMQHETTFDRASSFSRPSSGKYEYYSDARGRVGTIQCETTLDRHNSSSNRRMVRSTGYINGLGKETSFDVKVKDVRSTGNMDVMGKETSFDAKAKDVVYHETSLSRLNSGSEKRIRAKSLASLRLLDRETSFGVREMDTMQYETALDRSNSTANPKDNINMIDIDRETGFDARPRSSVYIQRNPELRPEITRSTPNVATETFCTPDVRRTQHIRDSRYRDTEQSGRFVGRKQAERTGDTTVRRRVDRTQSTGTSPLLPPTPPIQLTVYKKNDPNTRYHSNHGNDPSTRGSSVSQRFRDTPTTKYQDRSKDIRNDTLKVVVHVNDMPQKNAPSDVRKRSRGTIGADSQRGNSTGERILNVEQRRSTDQGIRPPLNRSYGNDGNYGNYPQRRHSDQESNRRWSSELQPRSQTLQVEEPHQTYRRTSPIINPRARAIVTGSESDLSALLRNTEVGQAREGDGGLGDMVRDRDRGSGDRLIEGDRESGDRLRIPSQRQEVFDRVSPVSPNSDSEWFNSNNEGGNFFDPRRK